MSDTYSCWKCGARLQDLLLPLSRHEECPHCRVQLHVCRMCALFDSNAPQQCREPVADLVADKQRANFCGWFQINPHAYSVAAGQDTDTRRQLAALFGDDSAGDAPASADADPVRRELDDLFRK